MIGTGVFPFLICNAESSIAESSVDELVPIEGRITVPDSAYTGSDFSVRYQVKPLTGDLSKDIDFTLYMRSSSGTWYTVYTAVVYDYVAYTANFQLVQSVIGGQAVPLKDGAYYLYAQFRNGDDVFVTPQYTLYVSQSVEQAQNSSIGQHLDEVGNLLGGIANAEYSRIGGFLDDEGYPIDDFGDTSNPVLRPVVGQALGKAFSALPDGLLQITIPVLICGFLGWWFHKK